MKHSYREITRDPSLFWWGAGGCVNSPLKLQHLRPKNGNLFLQVSILRSWFRLLLHKKSQKTVQFLVDGQALVCAVNRMAKIATNSTVGFRTRTVCLTAGEIPLAAKLIVHGAPDGRWNPTRGQTSRQRGPSSIKKTLNSYSLDLLTLRCEEIHPTRLSMITTRVFQRIIAHAHYCVILLWRFWLRLGMMWMISFSW